ncbi:hypothetical protein [Sinorhizobium alkalisoli]|nr:hypothetical protein [Sinorhizobium alkalisoli]MCG5481671.1 hypothetical protein [Sinorhizobium alkalisoli]
MLLPVRYDLSDVKLAEDLDYRASFRRFCEYRLRTDAGARPEEAVRAASRRPAGFV